MLLQRQNIHVTEIIHYIVDLKNIANINTKSNILLLLCYSFHEKKVTMRIYACAVSLHLSIYIEVKYLNNLTNRKKENIQLKVLLFKKKKIHLLTASVEKP